MNVRPIIACGIVFVISALVVFVFYVHDSAVDEITHEDVPSAWMTVAIYDPPEHAGSERDVMDSPVVIKMFTNMGVVSDSDVMNTMVSQSTRFGASNSSEQTGLDVVLHGPIGLGLYYKNRGMITDMDDRGVPFIDSWSVVANKGLLLLDDSFRHTFRIVDDGNTCHIVEMFSAGITLYAESRFFDRQITP